MFWKRKKDDRLVPHRNDLNAMALVLLDRSGIVFDDASQLDQALVGTFLFGMIQTHCMMNGLTPPDVHSLSLAVFMDTLHYTGPAAVHAVQECINATNPKYHDTMNAILHRGVDGHRQYQEGDLDGLGKNIRSVIDHFKKKDG